MGVSSETKFLQELILYAASAALSCLVLFAGLRHLDPNREASKKALEHKKEIAKRLGRPLIQTNPYEVPLFVSFSNDEKRKKKKRTINAPVLLFLPWGFYFIVCKRWMGCGDVGEEHILVCFQLYYVPKVYVFLHILRSWY